jgi:hypothetical protein
MLRRRVSVNIFDEDSALPSIGHTDFSAGSFFSAMLTYSKRFPMVEQGGYQPI